MSSDAVGTGIPLSRPDVTQSEIDAVVSVLRTDRLSLGPHLGRFEKAVADRCNRKYGIGVSSGTSGLHLCVRSLGIGPGDEVITTPFSFIATTTCVMFERARPVFVDIDIDSYNMDPTLVEAAVSRRTKAILPVEAFGNTRHFDRYEQYAREYKLRMIEDSCEALGGLLEDRPAGSFGDCSVFGFYPNKQITAGEGGVVVTDDVAIRDHCLAMRNQGRASRDRFVHEMLGYNYRLNELSAVMGEVQMARLDGILSRRQKVADIYQEMLEGIQGIHLPPSHKSEKASWFVYVIRLGDDFSAAQRNKVLDLLRARGIGCERYFHPIHLQPFVREKFGHGPGDFPVCEHVAERTIALPFFTQMTEDQVRTVRDQLVEAIDRTRPAHTIHPASSLTADRIEEQPQAVPFHRVRCDGNELEYIEEVLESGWLTTAKKTAELERRFSQEVGGKHACAVSSCTAALHLSLEAMGIGPGDKVLVPTMTFTASAEVVRYLGADPVLLDVEYGTSLLTPDTLSRAIEVHPDAKALIVVHFGGQPAEMTNERGTGILQLCHKHGIRVVEDAAHAFPARLGDRMIGSLGDTTCFSFYANKTITTGEGGMLVTDDPEIARRASIMRLHGIDRDVWDRFSSTNAQWEYDVVAPGYKYNMPDVNAAIGLAQLERAYDLWRKRYRAAKLYFELLADIPCLNLPQCRVPLEDQAWHLFVVTLSQHSPISRNDLIKELKSRKIGTSVHYKPLHRMTYYQQRYHLDPSDFPEAERIWQGCLTLPLFPSMGEGSVRHVCDVLRGILT